MAPKLLSLRGATFPSSWFRILVREGFSTYRQQSYECGCCKVIVVRICSRSHNIYVIGVCRNPNLLDNIFLSLSTAMAKILSVDRKASFVFVGHANAHHEEWFRSSTATFHGRAAREFAS